MTTNLNAEAGTAAGSTSPISAMPIRNQQVVDSRSRDVGASLNEMSTVTNWLPHSTRAFSTGVKTKDYVISSVKINGVRRYRIVSPFSQ